MNKLLLALTVCFLGCSSGSGSSGGTGGSGAGGSGGGSGGGTGQCPNVAGTWTVTQSDCQGMPTGAQTKLTQSGCTATDDEGTSIEIGSDGTFSYSPQGATCNGTATETTMTMNCSFPGGQCSGALAK
jgi:hypothetical protein